MTEKEFLDKYKDTKMSFVSMYKHRVTYESLGGFQTVSGDTEYRANLEKEETVMSLFGELDDFEFRYF